MTALALILSLAILGPDGGSASGAPADGPPGRAVDGGPADRDGAAADPDAEVIEHLDLLEQLELLERLELFGEPPPRPAPDGSPGR
ncbi:MAG TPA: hypothetical protein VFR85_10695 [Anaeromyxobacteraceae bacterium]|nr:hypothetical protein [Anaeromyxobacteraceae bacterium]